MNERDREAFKAGAEAMREAAWLHHSRLADHYLSLSGNRGTHDRLHEWHREAVEAIRALPLPALTEEVHDPR
jgi:hypothetical protein